MENRTFTFNEGFKAMNVVCDYLVNHGLCTESDADVFGADLFFKVMDSMNLKPDMADHKVSMPMAFASLFDGLE